MQISKAKTLRKFAICFIIISCFVFLATLEHKVSMAKEKEGVKSGSIKTVLKVKLDKKGEFSREKKSHIDIVHVHPNRRHHWLEEIENSTRPLVNKNELRKEMDAYKMYIKTTCNKTLTKQELQTPINSWEFFINKHYKLIYCPIFKSASSTWIYNFLLMAKAKKTIGMGSSSPVEFARTHYYPRPELNTLNKILKSGTYTSFLIIREPFERLLSAYKDKIESTSQRYYNSLRCKISGETISYEGCKPNFPSFVSYIIAEHKEGRAPDEHWAPYYSFCSPCQVGFDFVFRFETLAEEENLLFDEVPGLSSVLERAVRVHSSHTDYNAVLESYYSQLSLEQMEGLFSIYHKDFKIFDYDYTKYANMVG